MVLPPNAGLYSASSGRPQVSSSTSAQGGFGKQTAKQEAAEAPAVSCRPERQVSVAPALQQVRTDRHGGGGEVAACTLSRGKQLLFVFSVF